MCKIILLLSFYNLFNENEVNPTKPIIKDFAGFIFLLIFI